MFHHSQAFSSRLLAGDLKAFVTTLSREGAPAGHAKATGEHATKVREVLYPLSYTGTVPAAGFEPANTRVQGEVTLVFTTGRTWSYHRVTLVREHADTARFARGGFEPRRPKRTPAPEVAVAFTTDPVKLS